MDEKTATKSFQQLFTGASTQGGRQANQSQSYPSGRGMKSQAQRRRAGDAVGSIR